MRNESPCCSFDIQHPTFGIRIGALLGVVETPIILIKEVRDYAAGLGVSEAEAIQAGMAEKSREFVAKGAEFYQESEGIGSSKK